MDWEAVVEQHRGLCVPYVCSLVPSSLVPVSRLSHHWIDGVCSLRRANSRRMAVALCFVIDTPNTVQHSIPQLDRLLHKHPHHAAHDAASSVVIRPGGYRARAGCPCKNFGMVLQHATAISQRVCAGSARGGERHALLYFTQVLPLAGRGKAPG